jgi:hypothetical protein
MIILVLILILLILFNLGQNFTNVSPKKIAVITSIYGNYESIKNHKNVKNKDLFDWYCFTDNENLKSNLWTIINKPYHLLNTTGNFKNNYQNIDDDFTKNMMSAKYYKAQTHNIDILKDYDYYIWVDGSLFLRDSFVINVLKLLDSGDSDLINFKHSSRNNIKDEVFYCKDWKKYIKQDLKHQYNHYVNDGFPDNTGLFELTSFYRKNDTNVNKAFDLWWEHNLKYSYQDQVSFPYVLWKFNKLINHKVLNENVMKNKNYCYNGSHLK